MSTLHDRLTDRLGAIRNQHDDTSVLARELVDVVAQWLTSTEVASAVLLRSGAPVVVALVQEAEK